MERNHLNSASPGLDDSPGFDSNQNFIRSPYLALLPSAPDKFLTYHTLFGNLSWIDSELAGYLKEASAPIAFKDLARDVSEDVAAALLNSYYFVQPDEERNLITDWLAERQRLTTSGYFVGGLQISSSNACNFACAYCFADASDKRSTVRQAIAQGPANISFEMAEQAINKVLSLANAHGREQIAVKFLGREPLINWKVMQRLFETFRASNIIWAVTTNGSLLNQDVAKTLKEHNALVMVSLDGPPSVNDRLRVLKAGAGGTYNLAEAALHHLAEVGHPFGISTVVSRMTDFAAMRGFIDHIIEYGARELELTLVMQTNILRAQAALPDETSLAAQLVALYTYAADKGLLVHGDWVDPFHRILATHKFRNEEHIAQPLGASCSATSHQISLEPSGDMFPCRAMSSHYGHIDDLEAVLHSDAYRQVVMRTYFNVSACRDCALEGFCQGTCLGSAEEANKDIYKPQEDYCQIYRLTTRLLLNTLKRSTMSEESMAYA
jgi:uncharacterized protein